MGPSKRDIETEGHFIKKDKRQLKRFRRRQSERYCNWKRNWRQTELWKKDKWRDVLNLNF